MINSRITMHSHFQDGSNPVFFWLSQVVQKAASASHGVFRSSRPLCLILQAVFLYILYLKLPRVFPVLKTQFPASLINQTSSEML